MFKLHGIDHVALSVCDLEKSLEFYSKVLGFSVTQREISKPGVEYFLDCGSALIGLIQSQETEKKHLLEDGGLGGNHVSFRVHTKDFDKSVEEMNLSVRAMNCLKSAKIATMGELVNKTEEDLMNYKNFGKVSLTEIKEKLEEMKLSLGMEI